MSHRHRARRLALQGLCCLDVQGDGAAAVVRQFMDDSREAPETIETAHEMLCRTLGERQRIDDLLTRHARHWGLGRLALVDRNILRLAAWELLEKVTPVKVVISEALRIAQEFSTAESPRFVNGVIDAVAKELQQAQPQTGG